MPPIELFGAKIKCLGVTAETPQKTNDNTPEEEEKNFYKVVLLVNNPIKVYETEKSRNPVVFSNRLIRDIMEDTDGNVVVKTFFETYFISIH